MGRQDSRFRFVAGLTVVMLPALFTLATILVYSVDVPRWDEWDTPGRFFQSIIEGRAHLADYVAQHNESRMLFPKLIFTVVAFTCGWHVTIFMVLSWCCMVLASLILLRILMGDARTWKFVTWTSAFVMNLLLFSLFQWESWLHGINLSFFLELLCLVLGLWVHVSDRLLWKKVLLSALLSFVATFSYANGLLCWVVLFPVGGFLDKKWASKSREDKIRSGLLVAAYLVSLAATLSLYFWNYHKPAAHPSLAAVFKSPHQALIFFVACLGSPFAGCFSSKLRYASIIGSAILLIFVVLLALTIVEARRSSEKNPIRPYYPWLCLGVYSLLSVCIITVGRAGFGLEAALSSRYSSFSLWTPVGIVGLVHALWHAKRDGSPKDTSFLPGLILGMTILLALLGDIDGFGWMRWEEARHRQDLLTLRLIDVAPSNPLLSRLYPSPSMVKETTALLLAHRVLRVHLIDKNIISKFDSPDGVGGGYYGCHELEGGVLQITGWAMIPDQGVPADCVIICKPDESGRLKPLTGLILNTPRPDVAKALKNPRVLVTGFDERFSEKERPDSPISRLQFFAVDLQNNKVHRLATE